MFAVSAVPHHISMSEIDTETFELSRSQYLKKGNDVWCANPFG